MVRFGNPLASADELEKLYPLEDWNRDLDFWFSRGKLSASDAPQLVAYFYQRYHDFPNNGQRLSRMNWTLVFVEDKLEELIQHGAALRDSSGTITLPPSLTSALYRAFMSFPIVAIRHTVDVPLILELVKQQKDWNEDRT